MHQCEIFPKPSCPEKVGNGIASIVSLCTDLGFGIAMEVRWVVQSERFQVIGVVGYCSQSPIVKDYLDLTQLSLSFSAGSLRTYFYNIIYKPLQALIISHTPWWCLAG